MIAVKDCLNCGEELINLPKKRSKVFCNTTCRSNYWQKSDRLSKQGKTDEQIVSILEKERKGRSKQRKEVNKSETDTIPPMPVRLKGEDSFDFAARKNEWKKKYGS